LTHRIRDGDCRIPDERPYTRRPLHSFPVAYSVKYFVDLAPLPETARLDVQRTMEQIADAVSTVPEANPFWASMDDSVLQIDVCGYRVSYRILPRVTEVRVIELELLRPKTR
jgi:hypothetical protein